MKKAQVLLAAIAVLVVCTACAPAGAAPGPTPTPTKTPTVVPLPTPVGTPDPLWVDLHTGLQTNVWVCLVDAQQFEARIPTGPMVLVNFHWISTSEGVRIHTVRVTEETLEREGLTEFETFLFGSEVVLDEFARVVVYIKVGNREFEFWFPVEWCPPPTQSSSI